MPWSAEQVLALAPDASSAKSGKDLAAARKWKTLGADDHCAWGSIQGSGKDPYETCIDLREPAFKCSCPSRKFPCKHGLGLFLILAQQPGALPEKTPAPWCAEWLAKRSEKAEKKAAALAVPETPPDPEAEEKARAAAEKRRANRNARVTAGLDDLGIWLSDLVRTGFAALPGKPPSFWETPAARLIDAQVPGLARRVGDLDGVTTQGAAWPSRLLREASLLHLAREAWSRIDSLPSGTQCDLRSVLGFPVDQTEVLAQPGLRDEWMVVGQRVVEEDRIRAQRTWLFGVTTKRPALCLSFSAGPNQPLDVSLPPGSMFPGELVFFPSAWPLRALVKSRGSAVNIAPDKLVHGNVAEAFEFIAEALAANPWLERVPVALKAVTPFQTKSGWAARDSDGKSIPLDVTDPKGWSLVALSGGSPLALAGEWESESLRPLSVWAEGRFLRA